MKRILLIVSVIVLAACTTSRENYDTQYSDTEIAQMTAIHFGVLEKESRAALQPAFKKYGAPHAYIDGLMSSIDSPNANHLYGSGHFKTKVSLKKHTFWRVDGENLTGHLAPVKTAHLVYETLRLDPLSDTLDFKETLTKRGQKFSVFERKVGNEIIITVHRSDALPQTELEQIQFFRD